jgi:hypothetical protein
MAKYTNPFGGRLQLSLEDEHRLEDVASVFVRETLQQYQRHLFEHNGEVDTDRWKFVKQRENVIVYQERPGKGGIRAYKDMGMGAPAPAADLPILMGTGTIVGDLEDVMYGVVNPTQDMLRIKTSYVEDNIVDAAVLATIIEPSVSGPFRALTVKWCVKGRPLHVRSVIKNRDLVYLESTGIAQLANGERIGYQLLHSVTFPQIHELDTVVRGNMSLSAIYRQKSDSTVEVYLRGFLDPAGGLMRSIVVKSAAEALVSVWKNVHCAQMKKLAWVIRRGKYSPEINGSREQQAAEPGVCATCQKKSALNFMSKSSCRVCLQHVCHSCRVRKKLSFIDPNRRLVQQRVSFCAMCITKAINTSAHIVASDEILAKDSYNGCGQTLSSSRSASSQSASSQSTSLESASLQSASSIPSRKYSTNSTNSTDSYYY